MADDYPAVPNLLCCCCARQNHLPDLAGSPTGVSWRFNKSRDASPTMMGRYGAPSWVKPTSFPDQQLIYHLDEALAFF